MFDRKKYQREYMREYLAKHRKRYREIGRLAAVNFRKNSPEKYKAILERYKKTEKYRKWKKAYLNSPITKAYMKVYHKKYKRKDRLTNVGSEV